MFKGRAVHLANVISAYNSTNTALNAGASFTGPAEETSGFLTIIVGMKTDKNGTLYIEQSVNGTDWDYSRTFDIEGDLDELHRSTVNRKFYRIRFTNTSASNQTYLRISTNLSHANPITAPLNNPIRTDEDGLVVRAINSGQTDGGDYVNQSFTGEGHAEIAIHDPLLPFGSIHTESLSPVFQTDAVYGLNENQVEGISTLSGSVTATDSAFVLSSGTTIYA